LTDPAQLTFKKKSPPRRRASEVPDGAIQDCGSSQAPCAHVHGLNVFGATCPKLFRGGTIRNPESHGYPAFGFSGSIKMLAKIDLLSMIRKHVVTGWRDFKSYLSPSPESNEQGLSERLEAAIGKSIKLDIEMMSPEMQDRYRAALGQSPSPEVHLEVKHSADCPWDKTRLTLQRYCTCGAFDAEQPAAQTHLRGSIAAFEAAYPDLYYHVAKGKITAGEPLYGAIITTIGGTEIGHGESDESAEVAFSIAVASAGLSTTEGSNNG
jgi:hypothetical protein